MALLIRGGNLQTMTARGAFVGDVLISDGRILRVEEHIGDAGDVQILDAQGLTVLPGLIDVCLRTGGYETAWLQECMIHAGVTTGLLLPEDGGNACCLMTREGAKASRMWYVQPHGMTDTELEAALVTCRKAGTTPVLPVMDADVCRRLLPLLPRGTWLTGLTGCDPMVAALAEAGIQAVVGVTRERESPWRLACALAEAGVQVALSSMHPSAKMSLLPVCASLCVRDGMARGKALQTITSIPATMLHLHDAGCLAAGFRADLTVWDGDPLLLATSRLITITGGRILRSGSRY